MDASKKRKLRTRKLYNIANKSKEDKGLDLAIRCSF